MADGAARANRDGAARGAPAVRLARADADLTATADERHAPFSPIACDRCAAVVLVTKFSPQHTSVQWSPTSVRACAEFAARSAAGEQTARIDSCASLRDCIDRATGEGRLEVTPP